MLDNNVRQVKAAEQAVVVVKAAIAEAVANDLVKREHLAIHIAQRLPDRTFRTIRKDQIGDPADWEHAYDFIAQGKTTITARTGLPSRVVQLVHPELLLPDDVRFWGNWIEGDLIASCSGVQPWYDEAFSKMLLSIMIAHAETIRTNLDAAHSNADTYLGREFVLPKIRELSR